MGISAVIGYLQTLLDGRALLPGMTVEAHAIPLPVLRNGMPEPLRVYIWPSRVQITQPEMTGSTGPRRENHTPLLLALRQTVNQVASLQQFPALVDGLLSIIMAQPPNIPIDGLGNPTTEAAAASSITLIGVTIDVNFRYPRLVLDQRPATLLCEIGVSVMERVVP